MLGTNTRVAPLHPSMVACRPFMHFLCHIRLAVHTKSPLAVDSRSSTDLTCCSNSISVAALSLLTSFFPPTSP